MTILDAMDDPALFGPWFPTSWHAWRAFLGALFGLPCEYEDDFERFQRYTGRQTWPTKAAREGFVIVGRRGGKSRMAALVAVYLACFRDYRVHLAPGEVATVAVIAADRRQARVIMRYVVGFLEAVAMLRKMVANRTRESIELTNGVVIEVHTANFRLTRGYTLAAVLCDEIAFWNSVDDSANPASEILSGVRPGLMSIPGALLLCISSPYSRRGVLWETWRRRWGKDGDPVLVWQADTASMNPGVDSAIIAQAYEDDEAAASAEFGAQFRRDLEAFVSRDIVEGCIIPGRRELPPAAGIEYRGFVDPSGGSADSFTLAIAHRDRDDRVILDAIRERKPPFSPDGVCGEFAHTLKLYGVSTVTGDRYAGEWPRERLRAHGIGYDVAEKTRSELYRDLLPLLNSGRLELLDGDKRLVNQLCALERRTARSGKDSIDHAPGAHDDIANAVAGVASACAEPVNQGGLMKISGYSFAR